MASKGTQVPDHADHVASGALAAAPLPPACRTQSALTGTRDASRPPRRTRPPREACSGPDTPAEQRCAPPAASADARRRGQHRCVIADHDQTTTLFWLRQCAGGGGSACVVSTLLRRRPGSAMSAGDSGDTRDGVVESSPSGRYLRVRGAPRRPASMAGPLVSCVVFRVPNSSTKSSGRAHSRLCKSAALRAALRRAPRRPLALTSAHVADTELMTPRAVARLHGTRCRSPSCHQRNSVE